MPAMSAVLWSPGAAGVAGLSKAALDSGYQQLEVFGWTMHVAVKELTTNHHDRDHRRDTQHVCTHSHLHKCVKNDHHEWDLG